MSSNDDPILRWDPLVTPTSRKWTNQVSVFKYLLAPASEETLDSILSDYFTPNERELAIPATSPPYLVELQADHTERYRRLLAGRFRGVKDDTVTRLTMLYFGQPTEPLMSDLFRALDADVEILDGADVRTYEVRPPLHFLTAYDHRDWGREELRGTEAPLSYIPVSQAHATALKLGREIEDSEEGAPRSSLRGGGEPDDMDIDTSDDLVDDTEIPPHQGPSETIMHGFQGSIPFNPEADTIDSVIRHLLSLATHETDHIIELTHLGLDRLNSGADPVVASFRGSLPLSDQTVGQIRTHAKMVGDHVGCSMWFVRFYHEEPPATWRPSTAERQQMVLLGGHGESEQWRAYFPLPESAGPDFDTRCGTTGYATYMRTAMQVLLGRMNEPGDKHFAVAVYDDETVPMEKTKCCYGGLDVPPQVYEKLYRSVGRAKPWTVRVTELDNSAIALYLPGYEQVPRLDEELPRNYELVYPTLPVCGKSPPGHRFQEAWEELDRMLDAYLSDEMRDRPITVSLPEIYDTFESQVEDEDDQRDRHPGSYFTYHHDYSTHPDADTAKPPPWAKDLAKYLETNFVSKNHRAFHVSLSSFAHRFSLVPGWSLPENATPKDQDNLAFPLASMELEPFREKIEELVAKYPHPDFGDSINQGSVYITLEGVPLSKYCSPVKAVITPTTHPDDFKKLPLNQLSNSRFIVSLSSNKRVDFAQAVDGAIPWGPRYGNVAGFAYRGMEPSGGSQESLVTIENTPRQSPAASPKGSPAVAAPEGPPPAASSEGPSAAANPKGPSPASLKQPSIFDNGPNPTIPTTGPPKEPMLRTGGPGVPMVSKRVMTPTEQQRTQEALNTVRNKRLGRAITCNYKGCQFVTRADDTDGMQGHLEVDHVADRCPWCSVEFFAHMSEEDKERHMVGEHPDKIKRLANRCLSQVYGNRKSENGKDKQSNMSKEQEEMMKMARRQLQVTAPQPRMDPMIPRAPEEANDQEGVYNFCDRCGREHSDFTIEERDWHDNLCVPRAPHEGDLSWCETCGAETWRTRELSRRHLGAHVDWPHSCNPEREEDRHGPFCSRCKFPMADLGNEGSIHHKDHCPGFSGRIAQFCPWCGVPLGYIRDHELREKHIISCHKAENGSSLTSAEGTPYVLYPRCMWEESGPRPEDDQFYTGWRADLHPSIWTPNRGDLTRSIPSDRLTYPNKASRARAEDEARWNAEAVLDEAQDEGGRERGMRIASERTQRTENAASWDSTLDPEEDIAVVDPPMTATAMKRPAKGGKQPKSKRRRVSPRREEGPATERASPAQEPIRPEKELTPSAQEPTQSGIEQTQKAAPSEEEPRRSRRKKLPSKRPPIANPAPPKKTAAVKTAERSKRPDPPARAGIDGDGDLNFTPEHPMVCSRCFRRVPSDDQKRREGDRSFSEQMEAHMDPNGSCRIRRGRGNIGTHPITLGIGLPNQSGWLRDDDLPKGARFTKLKDVFKEEYPAYAPTTYPVTGRTTQSVWKHDPNNVVENPQSIKFSKALPMPPDRNASAVLPEDTAPRREIDQETEGVEQGGAWDAGNAPGEGNNEVPPSNEARKQGHEEQEAPEGGIAKAKETRPKIFWKNNDKTWRDRGEVHSEDEEPDPGAVRADDPQEGPTPPKKRRKRKKQVVAALTTPAALAAAEDEGQAHGKETQRIKLKVPSKRAAAEEEDDQREPKRAKTRAQSGRAAAGKKKEGGSKRGKK